MTVDLTPTSGAQLGQFPIFESWCVVPTASQVALAASCAGLVVVPNAGALFGDGENTDRYVTVITPPGYAFTIWAPIFAACVADTVERLRAPGHRASDAATVAPLTAAYAADTLWSIAAQRGRFAFTPVLLSSATLFTGVAFRRLQTVTEPRHSTTLATGLLLGWTTLASTVNLAAEAQRRGADGRASRFVVATTTGTTAVGAGIALATWRSRHGSLPLAGAAAWGLLTTAGDTRRPRLTRAVSGAVGGIVTLVAAARALRPERAPWRAPAPTR